MFLGKSNFHSSQPINNSFVNGERLAYPNNLSSKLHWEGIPDVDGIRRNQLSNDDIVYFPIAICQRALAIWQKIYIEDDYSKNLDSEFFTIADWLVKQSAKRPILDCWSFTCKNVSSNGSAMAQGQAISVLVRAYDVTRDNRYLTTAILLKDSLISDKHLTIKDGKDIKFVETPNSKGTVILNGWIFCIWGLQDLLEVVRTDDLLMTIDDSLNSLVNYLNHYDFFSWSKYDEKNLSSPFYHELHIAQLEALFIKTGHSGIEYYIKRWTKSNENKLTRVVAILLKSIQKLKSPSYFEFVK